MNYENHTHFTWKAVAVVAVGAYLRGSYTTWKRMNKQQKEETVEKTPPLYMLLEDQRDNTVAQWKREGRPQETIDGFIHVMNLKIEKARREALR